MAEVETVMVDLEGEPMKINKSDFNAEIHTLIGDTAMEMDAKTERVHITTKAEKARLARVKKQEEEDAEKALLDAAKDAE